MLNEIEKMLYERLKKDPKMIRLFESYVQNMGHDPDQAKVIVESIIHDKKILAESLGDMAKFEAEDEEV